MRKVIVIAGFLVMLVHPLTAADVAGSWKLDGTIGEFKVDLVCSFKQDEKKLTGACKGQDIGELPIKGETDGTKVTWSYEVNFQGQPMTVVYNATTESATAMKGDITVMGNPAGSFTGKKQ